MTIANYAEFVAAIDEMFAADAVQNVRAYQQVLRASKQKRKQEIARISAELKKLKLGIVMYKDKIRRAANPAEKKACGEQLNALLQQRAALVQKYNRQRQAGDFVALDTAGKIYACTRHLLRKYLLLEMIRQNPAASPQNPQKICVDMAQFKNAAEYQEAEHIKDYVISYMETYPERVKGSRYFIGLHKKATTLAELRQEIDAYFAGLNQASGKEWHNIIKSREGWETVARYPAAGLQAVRLKTKAALNYEGAAMSHCVGSYAARVENGETEIYSVRDLGGADVELKPHATIEFKDGKIKQIKGPHDKKIAAPYVAVTRDLLMRLAQVEDFAAIVNDKDIAAADKQNIGIYAGTDGKFYDLYNLPDGVQLKIATLTPQTGEWQNLPEGVRLQVTTLVLQDDGWQNLPPERLTVENLHLQVDELTPELLQYVAKMGSIKQFKWLPKGEFIGTVPDLSAIAAEEIELGKVALAQVQKIMVPPTARAMTVTLAGKAETLAVVGGENLAALQIKSEGRTAPIQLRSLQLPASLEKLFFAAGGGNMPIIRGGENLQSLKTREISEVSALAALPPQVKVVELDSLQQKEPILTVPAQLQYLYLAGAENHLREIRGGENLQKLRLSGQFDDLRQIPALPRLKVLSLHGKYGSLRQIDAARTVKSMFLEGDFAELRQIDGRNLRVCSLRGEYAKLGDISRLAKLQMLEIAAALPRLKALTVDSALKQAQLDFMTAEKPVKNRKIELRQGVARLEFTGNVADLAKIDLGQRLACLKINGSGNLQNLPCLPTVQTLEIRVHTDKITGFDERRFPQLRHLVMSGQVAMVNRRLDTDDYPQLRRIDWLSADISGLQYLKIGAGVQNFLADQGAILDLRELDLSTAKARDFGMLHGGLKLPKIDYSFHAQVLADEDEKCLRDIQLPLADIGGFSMSWAYLPQLKIIRLPQQSKEVLLQGMRMPALQLIEARECRHLRRLDLQYSHIEALQTISLGARTMLDLGDKNTLNAGSRVVVGAQTSAALLNKLRHRYPDLMVEREAPTAPLKRLPLLSGKGYERK